ncbi:MAG: YdbH domain-containing protein, partial [Pseudomonadales bacterium]|nr:YdbH domain-containing protein [Pseudomonadales bacterium]
DTTDNSLEMSDSAFTVQPGKWQSPVGQIEHQAIKLTLSNIDLLRNTARLTFDLEKAHLQASKLPFKQALLSATGTFEFTPEQINLKLRKKMQLQLQKIATPELRTSALTIHNTKEITLTLPLTAAAPNLAELQVSAINLHLSGATLRAAQHKFSYRSANLTIPKLQLAPLQLQLYTKVRGFSLLKNDLVQNLDINSQASVAGNRYRANFEINHNTLPLRLKGKIRSDSKFRHISGDWKLSPLSLASAARKMAELTNLPWPEELKIIAGDYRHSGQFKITKQKVEAQIQHKVTQLTLKIADTIARDINISSDSQYKDSRLSETGSLNIAEVNSGIAVTDISADFSLKNLLKTNRSLQLNNTKGKLLQGDFSLEPFSTTLEPLQGSSQINFSNLPLNNVLALEQNPSLSGSGSLQGKLPFRFSSGQLYIIDGQINAMDKGYIRYSANDRIRALAATNSGLKIALNILEDFYYEVLSIRLSYYPDGRLVLENQLSGNNPNWQQGHPIKFSINVEENLLALLKTLQFSSDLEKKIRQQIQKSAQ